MEPSEAQGLKALEDENAKLKRLLAEAMLDNTALKRRRLVAEARQSQACRILMSFAPKKPHIIDFQMKNVDTSRLRLQEFV